MRKIDSSQCEEREETASNEIVTVKTSPLKQEHMEDNVCHIQISARFLRLVGHFSIDFRRKRDTAVKTPSSPWLRNSPGEQMVLSFKP